MATDQDGSLTEPLSSGLSDDILGLASFETGQLNPLCTAQHALLPADASSAQSREDFLFGSQPLQIAPSAADLSILMPPLLQLPLEATAAIQQGQMKSERHAFLLKTFKFAPCNLDIGHCMVFGSLTRALCNIAFHI